MNFDFKELEANALLFNCFIFMVFQSLVFGTLVSFSSAVLDRKKLDFVEFWVLLLGVIKLLIVVVGVMG